MARTKTWEISAAFWELVEPLIPTDTRDPHKVYRRKRGGGRIPKYSNRLYFSAIVYVLRTGIIWNALPREKFEGLGSSALHQKFQQWAAAGLFEKLWQRGLAEYDELQGISWEWQAADGSNLEAPLAQESVGPNPTDREKKERNDTCLSTNLASRSRYTSTPPTGMTAWRWNLCYRPLWFNHRPRNPQSATCVWTLGMLAKRRPSAAMVSFPTSDPEERKKKTLKIVRNTRREGGSLN